MTVATTTKDQEQVRQDSPLRPDWVIIIYMAALHIAALFALFPSNFSWAAVGVAVFSTG